MTYFGFLLQFLVVPILFLAAFTWIDLRRGRVIPLALRAWPAWLAVLGHVGIALIYTTPWDNYLVATRVWWYDPNLVSGLILGWVPIEEYIFFVLQPILAGLWLLYLARRLSAPSEPLRSCQSGKVMLLLAFGLLWLAALLVLLLDWSPGVYLSLIFIWALPPMMLQIYFGLDIVWRYRGLVASAALPLVLYLSLADALAIRAGTWTIDPAQSLQLYLGPLPLEEFIFFTVTTILIVWGNTLILARESQERIQRLASRLSWLRPIRQRIEISSE